MNIEQYAQAHSFVYISVQEVRKLCSDVLPFKCIDKDLMIQLPPTVYAEVKEICEQEAFDYLLMSTKVGMTYDSEHLRWIPQTEDAFAWFTLRRNDNVRTQLRIIEASRTPQPS